MTELLSCPFCGGDPTPDYSAIIGEDAHLFHCQNGDCPAWPNVSGPTEAEAAAAWNRRPAPRQDEARALILQYRDDLRRPPAKDSVERRLAAIDAYLAKATPSSPDAGSL